MTDWLGAIAIQGGIAPLVIALVVAFSLARTRYAWLAILAAYLASVAMAIGLEFVPLTAGRKIVLMGALAALAGLILDRARPASKGVAAAAALAAGIASVWVFASLFAQREGMALLIAAIATAAFVALSTSISLSLRADGLAMGAAGLGLGLATGIAGVLSASIGFLISGVAVAAASGALLLAQVLTARTLSAGYLGALTIGVLCALFAAGSVLLAELEWYALPLMLLIPLAVRLPLGAASGPFARAASLSALALAAAVVPITAAWFAARGS